MKEINLDIITPDKSAFVGQVSSVTVPGTNGNFQILFNHAPIISSLEVGVVKFIESGSQSEEVFATGGGTVEVIDNKVLILAESLERKDQIDKTRAKESFDRARERISNRNTENIDLLRAEASLKRAINRLKLCEK